MDNQSPRGSQISSEHVEGTNVYSTADREKVGDIHHLMIDKKSGRVTYAVMSFGGFLGLGQDQYPIPWNVLKYDNDLDGYVTGITQDQLQDAPTNDANAWRDREWETRVHGHYGLPPYWEAAGYH